MAVTFSQVKVALDEVAERGQVLRVRVTGEVLGKTEWESRGGRAAPQGE